MINPGPASGGNADQTAGKTGRWEAVPPFEGVIRIVAVVGKRRGKDGTQKPGCRLIRDEREPRRRITIPHAALTEEAAHPCPLHAGEQSAPATRPLTSARRRQPDPAGARQALAEAAKYNPKSTRAWTRQQSIHFPLVAGMASIKTMTLRGHSSWSDHKPAGDAQARAMRRSSGDDAGAGRRGGQAGR